MNECNVSCRSTLCLQTIEGVCIQESGGNPKASASHATMSEAAGCLRDATNDLLSSMEEAASASGAVTTMIDNISKAIAKVYSFIAALKYK